MKSISSATAFLLLFQCLASPLLAQEQDILGRKTPPLASLAGFHYEQPGIQAGATTISTGESQALTKARAGEKLVLPSLNDYLGADSEPLQFQRVELFAPGARVMLMGATGVVAWQRDARQFFIATNRSTGVALAVDVQTGEVSGFAAKGNSKMSLQGQLNGAIKIQTIEEPAEAVSSCGMQLGDQPPESLQNLNTPIPESVSAAASGSSISFQAVVAVDTDNEWMAGMSNDPDTALTWITDAFLAMNVFYERDIETRLLIGDVILRTEPDPYSIASGPSDQMNEFATYWRNNMAFIDRDFATLFSGRGVLPYYYSGIAWLDVYCKKGQTQGGRTVGSYSFNAIGIGRTASNTALYIGHELGHNLGSPHTHCYNPRLDQCYSGESGCYSGPVSCPAGGKGTIMSYCHVSSGAGCGTNKSEFHPTVQNLIQGRLAANSPSCIAAYEEPPDPGEIPLFESSFESP
ncbi:MAG: M12 family metallo-peptidase [Xanthomonadales bacterium]|nr:M12 family metallo-peptidase [Xanthomonadales bacterium]